MTSGVRVAVAGVLAMGLLLGPKVRQAVAVPVAAVSRAAVTQALPDSLPVTKTPAATLGGSGAKREADSVTGAALSPSRAPESATSGSATSGTVAPESAPFALTLAGLSASRSASARSITAVSVGSSPAVNVNLATVLSPGVVSLASNMQAGDGSAAAKGPSYLDGMRAAGYPLDLNNDLDTLVALKSVGVTPEYAKQMANAGLGRPSAHELITLKALGVTPEYVSTMKASGLGPKDFHEVVTEKSLGITPEYAAAMKQAGLGNVDVHELISLKAQGMTPEYAQWLRREFPQITVEQMKRAAIFHIDEKFVAGAKGHGFDGKDVDKLLKLKMSGLLDE